MNITTLTGNFFYRIGDCILNNNIRIADHIFKNKKNYENSFLYKYLIAKENIDKKTKPHIRKPTRVQIAADVVADITNSNVYPKPPQDTLVVHLRLGDVFNISGTEFQQDSLLPSKSYLLKMINNTTKKNVIIVTAFHHGQYLRVAERHNIDTSNNKSIEFLDELLKNVDNKLNVSVQSSANIDDDFIFLCLAEELVISGWSTFGITAKKINSVLKTNQKKFNEFKIKFK